MKLLPDAIHVGFSKCGSSFLQSFFSQHPDIFLVHKFHFFSPFDYSAFEKGAKYYDTAFTGWNYKQVKVDSDEHILLPLYHPVLKAAATTIESVDKMIERIYSVCPNTKIIIVVRNQLSLITSRYSEYLLGGGNLNFDRFIKEFISCSIDGLNYYQNFYHKILIRFYNKFGKDNVLLILQEELKSRQKECLGTLCNFLGVSLKTTINENPRKRRVGLTLWGARAMKKLNNALVIEQEIFYTKAKTRVPYFIYKNMQRVIRITDHILPGFLRGNRNALITESIRNEINEIFKDDNKNLADLLNKNLKQLGYFY